MKQFLVLAFLFLGIGPAYAGQWIGPYLVTRLDADTVVHFLRAEGFPNPDNCSSNLYVIFEGNPADPADKAVIDRALSIGLMAKATDKQVRFYTNGCSSTGYIRAYSIELYN